MDNRRRPDNILLWFFLFSLLVHLVVLLLVRNVPLFPVSEKRLPVVVEMRPTESREISLPRKEEIEKGLSEKTREKPAKHIGLGEQVVEKEVAPKGQDFDDLRPTIYPNSGAKPSQAKTDGSRNQPAGRSSPISDKQPPAGDFVTSKNEEVSAGKGEKKLPDIEALRELPRETIARLQRDAQPDKFPKVGDDVDLWRTKYRKDVEEGDGLWIDMTPDLLASFMRRLHVGIYREWMVPYNPGVEDDVMGLVYVVFNRGGDIEEIKLLETTGFKVLDEAFITAIKNGGPYGPIPRSYKKDSLKLYYYFIYEVDKRKVRFYYNH